MSAKFELTAEPRSTQGTSASRRLRRTGKVPAVLYGAGKPAMMISLDHNTMLRQLGNEAFHTSILTVQIGSDKDQVILRDYHMHPVSPQVLHVDLQRISSTEKLHMRVPLHFIGQDVAPGVKLEGGLVMHAMTEIDITCLPKDLPEYLVVDMSNVALNQSVHLSDIKLPEGVVITQLAHGGDDLSVAAITLVKEVVEVAPVVEAAAATPEAGAAPGATPAAEGEAKGETKKAEAGKKPEAKKEGK